MKPVSDLHAAARRYASNGWPVFPCLPGLKRPATDHGFHDATSDLAKIDAWFQDNPRLNIAFCPHQVGLAIIDIDGEPGEKAWAEWQLENGTMPATYAVRTPRGGRHLYYVGVLPPTQSKLGVHVDTRGVGSYALLPPSVVGGRPYEVLDETPATDLPAVVGEYLEQFKREHAKATVEDLDQPQNVSRAERLLRDYVERGHVAVEGQMGDQRTFITACEVMNLGLSPDKAFDLIADIWNPDCLPPWDEDELRGKIDNAARYSQNEAGAWATETSDQAFGSALDKLAPELAAPSPEPTNRRFKRWSLAELRKRPPPNWLIPDAIPERGVAMLYGPGGSLKSFLALRWACELASLGQPVLFVAGEGSIDFPQRVDAWKLLNGVEGDFPLEVVEEMPWAKDELMVEEFVRQIEDFKPVLVVIDTLARASVGLNENDARDMGQFIAAMDHIKRRLGTTILFIHHTDKASTGPRGSSAIEWATDAAIEVKRHEDAHVMEARVTRQKFAAEREEPWCFEERRVGPSLALAEIEPAELKARIAPSRIGPKEIGAALRKRGIVGVSAGISTSVLAFELTHEANPDLSDDEIKPLCDREARVLGKRGRGDLQAYCVEGPHGLLWCLPD